MHENTTSEGNEAERVAPDGSGSYRASTPQRQQWSDGGERFRIFAVAQAAMMILLGVALFALEMWTPEFYFVVSFLGLLVVRTLLAPTDRIPVWWSRLNWVVRAGFVVFGYLVLRQLPVLLP
ncbi:hypothetical protein NDI76_13015 [Halogeometricum sp. S1BR25-6]|uniref:Uncharacterized protein n=1 Tax=Halogeometricum salsisoli TaxID=2950536 RepID=A0ABU2GHV8_9EURY|nr:hypothetical protein [Halogeometricum sp. S1BR25-6]MDS0299663.1 hypothetical protein [Halogeometricum sp. S1BR25-6]